MNSWTTCTWAISKLTGRGNFVGCLACWKAWESLLWHFRQQEKSMTAAGRLQPAASLLPGRCHTKFSPTIKSPPPSAFSSKFFDHLYFNQPSIVELPQVGQVTQKITFRDNWGRLRPSRCQPAVEWLYVGAVSDISCLLTMSAGQTAWQEATIANRQNLATEWSRSVCWRFIHQSLGTISHPWTGAAKSTSVWCECGACHCGPDCLLTLHGVCCRLVRCQLSVLLPRRYYCRSYCLLFVWLMLFLSVLWSQDLRLWSWSRYENKGFANISKSSTSSTCGTVALADWSSILYRFKPLLLFLVRGSGIVV